MSEQNRNVTGYGKIEMSHWGGGPRGFGERSEPKPRGAATPAKSSQPRNGRRQG